MKIPLIKQLKYLILVWSFTTSGYMLLRRQLLLPSLHSLGYLYVARLSRYLGDVAIANHTNCLSMSSNYPTCLRLLSVFQVFSDSNSSAVKEQTHMHKTQPALANRQTSPTMSLRSIMKRFKPSRDVARLKLSDSLIALLWDVSNAIMFRF